MGAFDNYQPPTKGGGAFSNYQPPSAAPPQQDLGTTAFWNKPASASWSDYLMAHLSKPFQGANQAAQDYSRTAVDAATFGLGDRLQSAMTGNPLAQERAATSAAAGRLGAMAPIVQGAMYAAGPGELGLAPKVAGALGGGRLAGIAGGAGEGALAGGLGAAGHDEGIVQGALIGGGLGAAGGALGGVADKGKTLAPAQSLDQVRAAAKQAYDPLSNILYDAKSEVHPEIDVTQAQNALKDWSGAKWDDASKTSGEIRNLLKRPQLSANDLQQSQSYFKGIAGDPRADQNDQLYAGYFAKKLQGVLEQGIPQTGVPPGGGPGYAAGVKAAGDVLYGRAEDLKRLQGMETEAARGGQDVGTAIKTWLPKDEAQKFAPQPQPGAGPNAFTAYQNVADTAGPNLSLWPSTFDLRHAAYPLTGAGAGLTFGLEQHHDPSTIAAETLAGAVGGFGLHRAIPYAYQRAVTLPARGRALDALNTTLSTGQYAAPVNPTPLRDALRTLIFGRGAAGGY